MNKSLARCAEQARIQFGRKFRNQGIETEVRKYREDVATNRAAIER